MITCTNHFVSKAAADRYYQDLGYPNADHQVDHGEIQIGKPAIGPGEELAVIRGEGRYQIVRPGVRTQAQPLSLQQELGLLEVRDGRIILPKEHLKHYAQLKQLIEKSSGQYHSNGYFGFPAGIDAADVLLAIKAGRALNGKKESQSFFTPEDLAYDVCRAAGPLEGRRVLEPSAGHGALADIAEAAGAEVVVVENYRPNVLVLQKKGYDVFDRDFLSLTLDDLGFFDIILANPPFSRNQDIDHINHMWQFLKPGGVLSAIASMSWLDGSQKKQKQFRAFLNEHDAEIVEIDSGAFQESGTMVSTVRIRVRKPECQLEFVPPVVLPVSAEPAQMGLLF